MLWGDVVFVVGIFGILVMLLLLMLSLLFDLLLVILILIVVLVLMIVLFIKKLLEFLVFLAVLFIIMLLCLGFNIVLMCLILLCGYEGMDVVGEVIEVFGVFVMQGNVVIGVIVFVILVIVNFVVIIKGFGCIVEVVVCFILDFMFGKQMVIDVDLFVGLIIEYEVKECCKEFEGESNFYGVMDGVLKFVCGDVMVGLMIMVINLIGGIIIGVVQLGMLFVDVVVVYFILIIGDGFVLQILVLIILVVVGLLVFKVGVDGEVDKVVFGQLMVNL